MHQPSTKQIKVFEEERESIVIEEDSLKDYYNLLEQLRSLNKEIRDIVLSPRHCLPFLQPGRLVSIQCTSNDEDISPIFIEDQLTWGLIINFERIKGVSEDDASIKPEDASYKVDILTRCV
ncbi:superkiller viralicidic activity 2-like 2-like, partial [Trifolium medium]|nr:superkiller viralicidic activity 2-like 2-like [Trifolium medium]